MSLRKTSYYMTSIDYCVPATYNSRALGERNTSKGVNEAYQRAFTLVHVGSSVLHLHIGRAWHHTVPTESVEDLQLLHATMLRENTPVLSGVGRLSSICAGLLMALDFCAYPAAFVLCCLSCGRLSRTLSLWRFVLSLVLSLFENAVTLSCCAVCSAGLSGTPSPCCPVLSIVLSYREHPH